jgi:uncharacterized protein YhbP (UPF0306 family)
MNIPDDRIVRFIKKHHVLTLATSNDNKPWCANCFYAYLEDENCFVFTSDNDTKHAIEAAINPSVAGSIVLETRIVGKIQGIQFRGIMNIADNKIMPKIKKAYLKRFPYAIFANTNLWILKINYLKMTDNSLGFGKKLIWKAEK